jgi:hypothetical protein
LPLRLLRFQVRKLPPGHIFPFLPFQIAEAAATAGQQAQFTAAVTTALAAQAAAAAPVAHFAIKLPDFWVRDPKMWFSQAEA